MKVDSTEKKKLSRSAEVWRRYRKSPTAMIGLAIISVIILSAIFADIIVPYDYGIKQVIPDRLQGPSLKLWGVICFPALYMARGALWCSVS